MLKEYWIMCSDSSLYIGYFRSSGVELWKCSEVAVVDRASVSTPSSGQSISGPGWERLVCNDWRRISTALSTVWWHTSCSSRYMEIRYIPMLIHEWNEKFMVWQVQYIFGITNLKCIEYSNISFFVWSAAWMKERCLVGESRITGKYAWAQIFIWIESSTAYLDFLVTEKEENRLRYCCQLQSH